jgi:hypothetical protein
MFLVKAALWVNFGSYCQLQIYQNLMSQETIIFSMAGVSKNIPPNRQILKNIYLSFFYGAKIGVLG